MPILSKEFVKYYLLKKASDLLNCYLLKMPILSIEFVKYYLLKKASELLYVENANPV